MGRLTDYMDRKAAPPDVVIAEIGTRQHGVVSAPQLRRLGIGEGVIRTRLGARRLHRVHRGVYAVGHSALSPEGRYLAAVLAMGGPTGMAGSILSYWRAAVSHRSAAVLWGLLSAKAGPVDVVVDNRGGRSKRPGIRIHRPRLLLPSQVTLRQGIPVTTPGRTISDLRRATSLGRPGAISARDVRRAVRQANVLGLPLEESDEDRTRGDLERDFLSLCSRHRIPLPEVNVRIGRYLVDFLWREHRFVVETDDFIHHRGKVAFQDDRGRNLELKRHGYEVLRLSEHQINEEPDQVVETLVAVLSGTKQVNLA